LSIQKNNVIHIEPLSVGNNNDIIIKTIQEWNPKYSMFFSSYRQPDLHFDRSLNKTSLGYRIISLVSHPLKV